MIDLKKKDSFSLFFEKISIFPRFFNNSAMKLSIGLKSPFNPLARIWARYFESLDSSDSASLEFSPKCLIKASKNS